MRALAFYMILFRSCFVTGSYDQNFMLGNWKTGEQRNIRAEKPTKGPKKGRKSRAPAQPNTDPDELDFSKKALHVAWHPESDAVAVACLNNLYLYQSPNALAR